MSRYTLSIGDLVTRTGVAEPTLRIWERRYGFPQPERTGSGHRRYSEEQAVDVASVLAARRAGLSLVAAINSVQRPNEMGRLSLYAELRRLAPELESRTLSKAAMLSLSHAIEDECLARADRHVVFGCFQHERFYRQAQHRWRELARGADAAGVFAGFPKAHLAASGLAEIPISVAHPLVREWAIVWLGERSAVCLVGREPPGSGAASPSGARSFEALWTVDPELVVVAARICADLATGGMPELAQRARERIRLTPVASIQEQLGLATAVINRTLLTI